MRPVPITAGILRWIVAFTFLSGTPLFALGAEEGACSASAQFMRLACEYDVKDDFFETKAICDNLEAEEVDECMADVAAEREETEEECEDVLEARLELCEALDDAAYNPPFGEDYADNFVDPLEIGTTVTANPYLPLVAGYQWTYESEEETIIVTVMDKTKLIDGITCIVVNDVVLEDDVVIEDTDDWMAQDVDGNVWYCGEIAENYELFDGDDPEEVELVDIEGSWKAGRDGAEAGILMPGVPAVGAVFRQEVLFGEAEDAMEVLSITGTEVAPGGTCTDTCVVTRDFSPLDPDEEENKYYSPGIGLILEVDLEEDIRVELIEFNAR